MKTNSYVKANTGADLICNTYTLGEGVRVGWEGFNDQEKPQSQINDKKKHCLS